MTLLAVAHAVAVPAVFLCNMPGGLKTLAIAVIAGSFIREFISFRRARVPGCVYVLDGADRWWVEESDGRRALRLVGAPYVHPLLVVARLRDGRRTTALVLTRDNCDADTLRRLRVRLRYPLAMPDVSASIGSAGGWKIHGSASVGIARPR